MSLVQTDYQTLAVLAAKRILFNSQTQLMFLYTNNRTPSHLDTAADYTPATYHGASGRAVAWNTVPAIETDGTGYLLGDACIFQPTAGGLLNSVYGYFVIEGAHGNLVYAERFDGPPVSIGGTTDPFTVLPVYRERSIP